MQPSPQANVVAGTLDVLMDYESSRAFTPLADLVALAQALRNRDYRFVAITPASHRTINARPENRWARNVRDVFGWSRPFTAECLDPDLFALAQDAGVLACIPEQSAETWRSQVRGATLDGTIFLHSAFPTDAPDAVFFGPDTYRFAAAITGYLGAHPHSIRRAIDIGCGAGAGGVLIARAAPDADIILSDINAAALDLARVNAVTAGVTNVRFRHADLFAGIDGTFDLIVSNPPYLVDPQSRTYRHGGGALGAGLSLRIVEEAQPRLTEGGALLLYTGSAMIDGEDRFLAEVASLLNDRAYRWDYREADPDVFGEELTAGPYRQADRIAAVVLTVQRTP